MKKIVYICLFTLLLLSCEKDRVRNVNPFLPDYSFSITINTDLPMFSALNFSVQPMYINQEGAGIRGIFVMKVSDTDFRAFDAACPSQTLSECSTMTIEGLEAKCNCEGNKYSLFTGVGTGQYTMKQYRVEVFNPTNIRVYN